LQIEGMKDMSFEDLAINILSKYISTEEVRDARD
jgi:hypothetical protein